MKPILIIFSFCYLVTYSVNGQQNNTLRGKVLFLNSGKTPAIGVEISGTIKGMEKANTVYTLNDGAYQLIFPNARDGFSVKLNVGDSDKDGKIIEVVNEKEVEICRIPAKPTDEFEIIVCQKGARDIAAQKYYNIIINSSKRALDELKNELNTLQNHYSNNLDKIKVLERKIEIIEKESKDSITILKEALFLASINKDDASDRMINYLECIENGSLIQNCIGILDEAKATKGCDSNLM